MKKFDVLTFANNTIDKNSPPFFVAEMSGNHNQSLERALHLIEVAKKAGADAVKIQTYTPDTITINSNRPEFQVKSKLWNNINLYDLYKEAYTPWEWHEAIFAKGRELDIPIFSSPFDNTAVDLLESLNCPVYKIASPEIVDIPLIEKVARTGKPIIMSTGMATEEEVIEAYETAVKAGAASIALLHCISSYPAPADQMNLLSITRLQDLFGDLVGLSDHSIPNTATVMAIALRSKIIEKHFTLNREEGGVDSAFSLEPEEFLKMKQEALNAFNALGKKEISLMPAEEDGRKYRRSLYVVKPVKKGDNFNSENIRSIRPASGLEPKHYKRVLSAKASMNIEAGVPLEEKMITKH